MRWIAVAVLAGCNLVYGLEPTTLRPPDIDGDTFGDDDDNCPTARNPDQGDEDDDGFGDACDGCLGQPTPTNHDEDLDRRGDLCDACPMTPDLGEDFDRDGVGDECEQLPGTTTLVYFEPFFELSPRWSATGGPWQLLDDAVAPIDPPVPGEGLVGLDANIAGTWYAEIGVRSTQVWVTGDRFGIAFADAAGIERASCTIECAAQCEVVLRASGTELARGPALAMAAGTIRLVNTAGDRLTCVAMGTVASAPIAPLPSGAFAIHGAPEILTTYLAVWQHAP